MILATGQIANLDELPDLMKRAELQGEIITPGSRLLQKLDSHAPGSAKSVKFYLYGAGRHTARLLMEKSRWEAKGHRLIGLIDDHPRYQQDPQAHGLPVISLAAATTTLSARDIVILSTDTFEHQFWKQTEPLRQRGITIHRLYG